MKPIIFGGESVRAILSGSKTQTRRVVKPQPEYHAERQWLARVDVHTKPGWAWYDRAGRNGFNGVSDCADALASFAPYEPGDRVWVRETFTGDWRGTGSPAPGCINYRADGEIPALYGANAYWRSPIHMPRWASRITLEIVDVRAERLHCIDEDDLLAEGAFCTGTGAWEWFLPYWDTLNRRRGFGWDSNPWVWVVEFRRVQI